jgi:hypothetical protein
MKYSTQEEYLIPVSKPFIICCVFSGRSFGETSARRSHSEPRKFKRAWKIGWLVRPLPAHRQPEHPYCQRDHWTGWCWRLPPTEKFGVLIGWKFWRLHVLNKTRHTWHICAIWDILFDQSYSMIDLIKYLKVVVLRQMSHEQKICKSISYADLSGFWLVNIWIKINLKNNKIAIILQS